MSRYSNPRFIPTLLVVALAGLAGSAQADPSDCDLYPPPPGTPYTQINVILQVDKQFQRNLCNSTQQTLSKSDSIAPDQAHGSTTATADFGLQTVHAALDAKNIAGLGSAASYHLIARSVEFITASADTSFVITSRLLYNGSRVVSNPDQDRLSASGSLKVTDYVGFPKTVTAGPTDPTSQTITTGVLHLGVGKTLSFVTTLEADMYVRPNGMYGPAPGWALLDAQFITTIEIANGGALSSSSSHNYSIAAVPEPETWALMLSGLGLLTASARRRSGRLHQAA